tara:strand:- start:25 stop:261 length:237 start_codon:yes stop_codon:yes gene_type:complete
MALIDNWKSSPKMYVVQILATIALVQTIWAELPAEVLTELPKNLVHYVTLALSVAGIILRVIKQDSVSPPTDKDTPSA